MPKVNGYKIGPRANLSGADLPYAELTYANLSGADLPYAELTYANLPYANLGGATLRGAILVGAPLHAPLAVSYVPAGNISEARRGNWDAEGLWAESAAAESRILTRGPAARNFSCANREWVLLIGTIRRQGREPIGVP